MYFYVYLLRCVVVKVSRRASRQCRLFNLNNQHRYHAYEIVVMVFIIPLKPNTWPLRSHNERVPMLQNIVLHCNLLHVSSRAS